MSDTVLTPRRSARIGSRSNSIQNEFGLTEPESGKRKSTSALEGTPSCGKRVKSNEGSSSSEKTPSEDLSDMDDHIFVTPLHLHKKNLGKETEVRTERTQVASPSSRPAPPTFNFNMRHTAAGSGDLRGRLGRASHNRNAGGEKPSVDARVECVEAAMDEQGLTVMDVIIYWLQHDMASRPLANSINRASARFIALHPNGPA